MTNDTVECKKLGKTLPRLEKPPFSGELGELVFNNICAEGWAMWQEMQIKVLNEYRLNMGNADDYQKLMDQMLLFLNLKDGAVAEVENADRGQGENS